jgi:hypothetical protein
MICRLPISDSRASSAIRYASNPKLKCLDIVQPLNNADPRLPMRTDRMQPDNVNNLYTNQKQYKYL